MKAEELRIGNLINYFQDVVAVTGIRKDNQYYISGIGGTVTYFNVIDAFTPIPLTPEWLEKFGFYKSNGQYAEYQYYSIDTLGSFPSYIDVDGNFHWFSTVIPNVSEIKYVHQLQNLYFTLTGEELILTP